MSRSSRRRHGRAARVLLIIENVPFARDHRARKQAAALASNGYDVTVICRRDERNRAYADSAGVRLLQFPPPKEAAGKIGFLWEYGFSLVASFVLCLRAALRGGFDVMQIGNPPDAQFLLGLPFKLFGCSLLVDQRDLSPEVYADRYGTTEGFFYTVISKLERYSWRSADHIITVNASLVDTIVERGEKSRTLVTVVGNGPHRDRVANPNPDLKRGRERLVTWLGLMGPQDHVDLALQAAHEVVHTHGRVDCQFAFIGDGEELPRLQELSRELGIEQFVTFTGWLNEPECSEYLASSDLALDTNLQPEVTPVKGLEYMSFGVPMVAFDLCETRRMAGDAASYAVPGDAIGLAAGIVELLDDDLKRARMGAIGRRRIDEALAWEHQEIRYICVYSTLMEGTATMERRPKAPIRVGLEEGPATPGAAGAAEARPQL
jgi:glycosyltransferase involved in cell wall biosynthesis